MPTLARGVGATSGERREDAVTLFSEKGTHAHVYAVSHADTLRIAAIDSALAEFKIVLPCTNKASAREFISSAAPNKLCQTFRRGTKTSDARENIRQIKFHFVTLTRAYDPRGYVIFSKFWPHNPKRADENGIVCE